MRRVLIANRGEIALRIIRACRELGLESVAVFSEADARAPFVRAADAAVCVGPPPSTESYLRIDHIIDAARKSGADAVHPGYGFLAENAAFAGAVVDAGLTFVGPPPDAIASMGDKTAARQTAVAAGVPVVPALETPPRDGEALVAAARALGFPLLIKAAAGGGGKGMRIVHREEDVLEAFMAAAREAAGAFGDDRLFLERYIERPRHVEVQILADHHGAIVHLGERECSIQRRHQKIIEETPSPAVGPALRARMTAAALAVARAVGYRNAGTVEFILDPVGNFYFLEVNTRLQVEHPITELVTGIDLVRAQLRIAAGEPLSWAGAGPATRAGAADPSDRPATRAGATASRASADPQDAVVFRGHAIECRVYAEDPAHGFLPSPGAILALHEPQGPGVRVDSGIAAGFEVPLYYDPLLSKVSAHGEDRDSARRRLVRALRDYTVLGCTTTIPFLIDVLEHPAFASGDTHTHFIADHFARWAPPEEPRTVAAIAAALDLMRHPTATAVAGNASAAPSPWQTLGSWRLGRTS